MGTHTGFRMDAERHDRSPFDAAGRDRVAEASEESFPASDPPAWVAGDEPPPEEAPDERSAFFRAAVGRAIALEFETGVHIFGTVTALRPTHGSVNFVVMADAQIVDPHGLTLEEHPRFVICVAPLARFGLAERDAGRPPPTPPPF